MERYFDFKHRKKVFPERHDTLYSIASVQLNAAISDPLSHRKHNTSSPVRSLFIPSFVFKLHNNKLVSRNASTAFL